MNHALDQLKPFAIKAISARIADEITEAARTSAPRETVGQLVERVWEHWKADGRPIAVSSAPPPLPDLTRVERLVAAAVLLAGTPDVPNAFRGRANRLLREALPAPVPRPKRGARPLALEGPAPDPTD